MVNNIKFGDLFGSLKIASIKKKTEKETVLLALNSSSRKKWYFSYFPPLLTILVSRALDLGEVVFP